MSYESQEEKDSKEAEEILFKTRLDLYKSTLAILNLESQKLTIKLEKDKKANTLTYATGRIEAAIDHIRDILRNSD